MAALLLILMLAGVSASVLAEEISSDGSSLRVGTTANHQAGLQQTKAPVMPSLPLLLAEGSNSCEIVSCGMGIKQTCQITCPAEKTPKCSCDCERSFGPMCMDYKANCRCE
ncbi:MAG: exported protein of unknown function [Nitrospira sp.]|jgi:hypothetical protein|nr:exported protein of unknown function [Nitrospira sp.]